MNASSRISLIEFSINLPVVEISDLVVPVVETVSFSSRKRVIQCWQTLCTVKEFKERLTVIDVGSTGRED